MFIPDPTFFHPGSDLFPSRIRVKEFKYFNPKKWFLRSRNYDPGCSSRIPDPDFYSSRIPDPGGQEGTGSAPLVATPTAACSRCVAGQLAVSPGTLCQTPGPNWGPRDRDRLHPRGEQHRGDALLPGHPPGAARPPGSPGVEARGRGGRQKKRLQVVENRPELRMYCCVMGNEERKCRLFLQDFDNIRI
jgi:hypothetical protein